MINRVFPKVSLKVHYVKLILLLAISGTAMAQGHGPLYGLQTPTLAKGGVDLNVAGMSLGTETETSYMLRYLFSYGITEDLQVNLTTPTMIERLENAPRTRGNSNMPANGDIEASLWYRFFSNAFGVGKRFESTVIVGVSAPTEDVRGAGQCGPLSTCGRFNGLRLTHLVRMDRWRLPILF